MRIEPKDFQDDAVHRLAEEIEAARREIDRGRPQAVVLSSPTGSGKTVIMTLLMERMWAGHESLAADPNAIFLWLSDSPELNLQSKDKIEAASDIFPRSQLLIIDNNFDRERLSPGHIYFLNTQKLGVSSLLTKNGDGRTWTIWQTIENTAKASPTHFNVIVDEAHRGMGQTARVETQTRTIVQRFIKGAPEVGLAPVPLVIGMSATPERRRHPRIPVSWAVRISVDDETILGRAEDASRNGLWVTVAPTTALKLGKSCWIDVLSEEIGRFTIAGEVRHVAGRRVGLETTRPVPVARLENAGKD